MLKPRLKILQVGQLIWASVEENQPNDEVLVAYQGDLLRVQNQTGTNLKVGQRVRLEVVAAAPLEFRLRPVEHNPLSRLDIQI